MEIHEHEGCPHNGDTAESIECGRDITSVLDEWLMKASDHMPDDTDVEPTAEQMKGFVDILNALFFFFGERKVRYRLSMLLDDSKDEDENDISDLGLSSIYLN